MEVKKIVEGMTAPQVAQVIDDNFKAQNAILEEDIAKQNNVIGVSEYKDFSEAEAVSVGDVRKYNGFLYECVEATTGAFDASKWKKSSFKNETEKKLSELGSKSVYFEPTSKLTFANRVKELYLQGLKANKKYYAKYLQRIVVGTYIADQIHIYEYLADDKSDEVKVASCEDSTFSEDVVKIKETNGSGISGYWVKHFKENDYVVDTLTSSSDIVKDTVSSLAFSPSIAHYLKSISLDAKFEEQAKKDEEQDIVGQNRNIYFKDTEVDNWQNLIKELYLQGLKPNKEYYCKIQRYNTNGLIGDELWLYEYDSDIEVSELVAIGSNHITWDRPIRISQRNESGIFGLFIRNFDKLNDYPTQFSKKILINKEIVGNINNSPSIKFVKAEGSNFFVGFYPESSKLKELYLKGLDNTKFYAFKLFKRYVTSGYSADQVYLYQYDSEKFDNPILVAVREDETFSKGVIALNEKNESGISGYIIKNIDDTDTELDLSFMFIDVYKASNIEYSPIIKNEVEISAIRMTGSENYGYYRGAGPFVASVNTLYITYENVIAKENGFLKSITMGVNEPTIAKIGVGFLDQRNLPLIRTIFDVDCKKEGENSINLVRKNIEIKKGERLFYILEPGEVSLLFSQWDKESNEQSKYQMIYGSIKNGLKRLATELGGSIAFEWEVSYIETPFVTKNELNDVSDKAGNAVDIANNALSKIGFFMDRQGNRYKAVVVDGKLSLIPAKYKNIVVFCNSIGINGRLFSQGWCGNRGMASSKYGLDFFSHLKTGFKQKDSSAVVTLKNIWQWENDFSYSYTNYDDVLTENVDCIVFRAGENVKDKTSFTSNLDSFVKHCITMCPNAEIIVTSMVWSDNEKDASLVDVATSNACLYANVAANTTEYREKVGHYLYGDYTNNGGNTWDTSQQVLYKITGSGIAGHTNDVGMLLIANNILKALGYTPLDLLHNIEIGNTNGFTCSVINTKWVENGVVNIESNGNNVSVLAADGTSINVTNHNDGVFTFDMPSQDVTISVL